MAPAPDFENRDWYKEMSDYEHTEWPKLRAFIDLHPELLTTLTELGIGPHQIQVPEDFYRMVTVTVTYRSMIARQSD